MSLTDHLGHHGVLQEDAVADAVAHADGHSVAFHTGYTEVILFEFWIINSVGGLLGSMAFLFIVSILYEGLKFYRELLYKKGSEGSAITCNMSMASASSEKIKGPHLLQAVFHLLQMMLSYLLMLVVMTFNVWLFLAVILGMGAGYLFFGWKRTQGKVLLNSCM